jgi:transcription initiation factor IIE alpha subunit
MARIKQYNEVLKARNELIWTMAKEYSDNELALIFNLTTEQVNRIIYTLRELKGSWV